MTAHDPHPSPPSRVRTLTSPEAVALVLAVLLVAPAALVLRPMLAGDGQASPDAPSPSRPPATAPRTAAPSPSPSPPSPAVVSRLVDADEQLLAIREKLRAALDAKAKADAIAGLLRQSNLVLNGAILAVPILAAHPDAAAVAGDLDALYASMLETNRDTLRASVSNVSAYRRGAAQLLEDLDRLESVDRRLRRLQPAATPGP